MGAYSNRGSSGSKDQRFLNMFPETRKVEQLENTKIFINKRPGLSLEHDFGSGEGRGNIYFNNKFYVAVGNKVYSWNGTTQTEVLTLTGSTGNVAMIWANSSTIGDYLFVCDGTAGWIIKTNGDIVAITSDSISYITITSGGTGYVKTPTLSFTGGSGSGLAATAVITGGSITSVNITNSGSGYLTAPTVVITLTGVTVTASGATDIFTSTSHGLSNGNEVKFTSTGSVPTGLTSGTSYFVVNAAANTFQIAATASGTVIDFTSDGSGTITCTPQPTTAASLTAQLNSFPTPHVPSVTFIDGYIVLCRQNSVDVYTCDLDEPTIWSSGNYLSAEMFPDPVIALARQNNQVVVFGHNSIEFFYDAANASGSPLSRNDSTTIQMGTAMPYGLYQNEQFCAYVSHSDSGGRAVWVINGFQPKKVSDEYIERILDAEADLLGCRAFGLRTMGHLFYIINLKSTNRTLVYDMDEKLWHEWSSNTAGNHGVFECNYMSDRSDGMAYLLHKSNGCLYRLDPTVYRDDGVDILCELVTNRYDMDTYNRKFMSSVKVVGDRYSTTNSVTLQWTDNDYITWSNAKTIDLTDDYPAFHRLGAFRRRAFKLLHSSNNPFRVESLECVYTEGTA